MVARARGGGLLDRQPVPPFYIYEHPALDFSWMRRCAAFDQLRRQAYNERLGEVAMTELLKQAPQRTWRPSEARLFFVPVWEFTSFTIGPCNGTSHLGRMARAAAALRASPHFGAEPDAPDTPSQAARTADAVRRPPGFDHLVLSTACIEGGLRAAARSRRSNPNPIPNPSPDPNPGRNPRPSPKPSPSPRPSPKQARYGALAPLLKHAVVGRDRADITLPLTLTSNP